VSTPIAFGQVGLWQIILVLVVVLLLFGANRLPKLARSLGASMTEFKKGLKTGSDGEPEPEKIAPKPEAESKDQVSGR